MSHQANKTRSVVLSCVAYIKFSHTHTNQAHTDRNKLTMGQKLPACSAVLFSIKLHQASESSKSACLPFCLPVFLPALLPSSQAMSPPHKSGQSALLRSQCLGPSSTQPPVQVTQASQPACNPVDAKPTRDLVNQSSSPNNYPSKSDNQPQKKQQQYQTMDAEGLSHGHEVHALVDRRRLDSQAHGLMRHGKPASKQPDKPATRLAEQARKTDIHPPSSQYSERTSL